MLHFQQELNNLVIYQIRLPTSQQDSALIWRALQQSCNSHPSPLWPNVMMQQLYPSFPPLFLGLAYAGCRSDLALQPDHLTEPSPFPEPESFINVQQKKNINKHRPTQLAAILLQPCLCFDILSFILTTDFDQLHGWHTPLLTLGFRQATTHQNSSPVRLPTCP